MTTRCAQCFCDCHVFYVGNRTPRPIIVAYTMLQSNRAERIAPSNWLVPYPSGNSRHRSPLEIRPIPSIPLDLHQITLLVRKADLLLLVKPHVHEVLGQSIISLAGYFNGSLAKQDLLLIIHPRLQHHALGPQIGQKAIMHQRTQPHLHPVRAPELLLANQEVDPPVVVAHVLHVAP